MIIKNANIVLLNKTFKGYVEFDQHRIIRIGAGAVADADYDAHGLYLLPAFFDSHTHGGYGFDGNESASLDYVKKVNRYFANIVKEGVGSTLMTTVSCSDVDLQDYANNYPNIKKLDRDNIIKGWYIEGPYLSLAKKGAHNPKMIRPIDLKTTAYIQRKLPNVVKLLAVAPEYEGNLNKLNKLKKDYFLTVAHSNASAAIAEKAFKLGANRVTHLYNQVSGLDHHNPGVIDAAFDNDTVVCELICDGKHVEPLVIKNTYKILGADRIMVISDSLMTKGFADGAYTV
ncbi:N-acetylglucosamine-6-phosphate deacetylase [Bacteroidales bacterium Barb4]|nr:N-acetylglucosamine-6-phosphate deacetylase [Bacteroidales bacterium Barb4]